MSGPILDRIDLHVEVPAISHEILLGEETAESSADIRNRILHTRSLQATRYANKNHKTNRYLRPRELKQHCRLDSKAERLLGMAIREIGFSARAFFKILKIARTIADLAQEEKIQESHVAEAIQYRNLDRNWQGSNVS